ncbi:MAG: hypothetical protein UU01_C0012G0010 [Parcubacteria group bacterium GW2011_GWA2_40_37]|nr:MAG: hypothetical protein UU01_C0012G0010 [Parcubacteria group bacterium GW2011_GWA2_40_37]
MSLREAMELEKTSNHLEWKKFLQSIGSNPSLKDKTVSIHWGELWDFVASAKGGSGLPSASFHSENSPLISNFANVSLCAQGENRTLMMLPSIDFESIASTNSATWAFIFSMIFILL